MEASFLFVNATEMYEFKAKDSDIKPHPLLLGNISKDFTIDNMKKKRLKGVVNFFSIDYNAIDTNYILGIHIYLMKKKHDIKQCLDLLRKCLLNFSIPAIGSFGSSSTSNYKKTIRSVSLNNQLCQTKSTIIYTNSDKTLYVQYAQVCVPNKVKKYECKSI